MKKYIKIYNFYKDKIENGQLKSGDKMPSIRQASALSNVSKTTIQSAYFALQADGYIVASEKSGHYVSDLKIEHNSQERFEFESANKPIIYDLKSGSADKDAFDLKLWQRYIKNALRQQDRLLTYSEPEGEQDLREALSDYIRAKRNIITSPDRIIIGAGVQSLLNIICSLIKDKKTVSFPDNSFENGISQFRDYGYNVHTRYKDADIIYVSPSHMTSYGDVMPIKRRLELVKYSKSNNSIVIEDDYDNDFLYQAMPTPSLYTLSGGENVIYMGSFSNVLIPGIRISFMVLTEELTKAFYSNKHKYSQTASKTEQIALCGFIRDGHIASQTRKIRRLYTTKAKDFLDKLKKEIPNAKYSLGENGLQVKMEFDFDKDTSCFYNNGILLNIDKYEGSSIRLVLIPSAISECEIEDCIKALKSSIS